MVFVFHVLQVRKNPSFLDRIDRRGSNKVERSDVLFVCLFVCLLEWEHLHLEDSFLECAALLDFEQTLFKLSGTSIHMGSSRLNYPMWRKRVSNLVKLSRMLKKV